MVVVGDVGGEGSLFLYLPFLYNILCSLSLLFLSIYVPHHRGVDILFLVWILSASASALLYRDQATGRLGRNSRPRGRKVALGSPEGDKNFALNFCNF